MELWKKHINVCALWKCVCVRRNNCACVPSSMFIYQLGCICSCASICVRVWVSVVSVVAGQPWLQLTHPYKAGREPSFLLINLAPPPVLVGGVQHLDDVTGLKRQLPVRHGHMVPYRLSVDDWTSTYQLQELEGETRNTLCIILITWSCEAGVNTKHWSTEHNPTRSKTVNESNLKLNAVQ